MDLRDRHETLRFSVIASDSSDTWIGTEKSRTGCGPMRDDQFRFMGLGRVELPTSRLSGD